PTSRAIWDGEEGEGLTRAMCEIGFIVSGFCPKHGWGPIFPNAGVSLGTEEQISSGDPRSPIPSGSAASFFTSRNNVKAQFPFASLVDGKPVPLTVATDEYRREESLSRRLPTGGLNASGGMIG